MPERGPSHNPREARRSICLFSGAMGSLLDTSLPPRYGGAELQIWLLANELARDESLDVHLMVDEVPAGAVIPAGITIHTFPKTIVRGMPGVSALVNIARWTSAMRATGCDWFFQMSGGTLTFHVALARVLLRRRMAFWLSTDADVDGGLLRNTPKARRQYLWARRQADVTFAQHDGQQIELERQGIASRILKTGFPIVEDTGVLERAFVLWVASCQRLKQPELFLELAKRLPRVSFVMIMTPRDSAYFAEVSSLAAGLHNLTLLSGVPDVRTYYDRASVLVNLSTVEGFPNTFLEAAMSSTPVVSLNVDPDCMLSSGAGVVCHGDFELLVGTVDALWGDGVTRSQLGRAARAYVEGNHDIAKTARTLVSVLESFDRGGTR